MYLRFYIDNEVKQNNTNIVHQLYIYTRNSESKQKLSHIRLINKTEDVYPIMYEQFGTEITLSLVNGMLRPIQYSKSIAGGLWCSQNTDAIKIAYDNVLDMSIPFDLLGISSGEMLEFFFATADFGILETFIPQEILLTIQRPLISETAVSM